MRPVCCAHGRDCVRDDLRWSVARCVWACSVHWNVSDGPRWSAPAPDDHDRPKPPIGCAGERDLPCSRTTGLRWSKPKACWRCSVCWSNALDGFWNGAAEQPDDPKDAHPKCIDPICTVSDCSAGAPHVHGCEFCFEHPRCEMHCTILDDLEWANGTRVGGFLICEECKRAILSGAP